MEERDLLRCVDRGLDAFGSNMRDATYSALRVNEGLFSFSEMVSNPDALEGALKSVFGAGYVFAERSIITEMKKKFDLSSPASSYTISDAFTIASKEIRRRSRNT